MAKRKWTDEDTTKLKYLLENDNEESNIKDIWRRYFANMVCYETFLRRYKIVMNMIKDKDFDKRKWTQIDTFILNNAMYNNLSLDVIKSLFPGKNDDDIIAKMNRKYA